MPRQGSRGDTREHREFPQRFRSVPIWLGLGLAALVCVSISMVVGRATSNFEVSSQWVEHTYLVIERIEALLNTVSEAENAQRNFIIAGAQASPPPSAGTDREISAQLAELRRLTSDNPEQLRALDELAPLIADRLFLLKRGIEIRQQTGRDAATSFVAANRGIELSNRIRASIHAMVATEDRLIARRTAAEHRAARLAFNVISLGWILGAIFLSMAAIYVASALRGLRLVTALAARRAEQVEDARLALSTNMEVLQSVFASMGEGVIVSLRGEAEPQLNPAAVQMLEIEDAPGAFARWLAATQIVADDGSGVLSSEGNPFVAVASGTVRDGITVALRKDGQSVTRWINASLRPLRASDGGVRGGVMVFRDNTEARKLDEIRATLASIVSATPDAIVSIDSDGKIVSWNHGAETTYGYTERDVLGQPYETLVVPVDLRAEYNAARHRIAGGEPAIQFETRRLRKSGAEFDASITDFAIPEQSGLISIGSVARDVTERKRFQRELVARTEELSRSNGELEQFAYVASHDLQEPLRMVTSYLQLIAGRYQGTLDADGEEFIRYAVDGATRMKQLIDDLLNFSRAGREPRHVCVNMNATRDRAIANLQLAIDQSGAAITSASLPVVFGDQGRLQELLQNLIENAIKFRGEAPPQIHLGCEARGGEYVFSVRDNGIGIAPEYQGRIFEMFRRLHGRAAYRGTGIGLAICKRVVERHHGRIWVESALGAGAAFYFSIPIGEGDGRDERPRGMEGSGHPTG